ncbi:MAG: trehalose-phosphatase [Betaproteobacteria bacterium]
MPPFAADWSFFLDIDGTLLEFAARPQEVRVEPGLLDLLKGLFAATGGAVALVSGRSVEDIDQLFAPLAFPAAGQHGTERRTAKGTIRRHAPSVENLGTAAAELVRLTAAHAGLVLENKGMTLALHYRLAPGLRALAEREMRAVAAGLGDRFELQNGKFVIEIKPSGKDKGSAIAEFISEAPFAGRRPVFIGDDLTDEPGFDRVNRAGGYSVKVGPGITRARWHLFDAAEVRRWLEAYSAQFAPRTRRVAR